MSGCEVVGGLLVALTGESWVSRHQRRELLVDFELGLLLLLGHYYW